MPVKLKPFPPWAIQPTMLKPEQFLVGKHTSITQTKPIVPSPSASCRMKPVQVLGAVNMAFRFLNNIHSLSQLNKTRSLDSAQEYACDVTTSYTQRPRPSPLLKNQNAKRLSANSTASRRTNMNLNMTRTKKPPRQEAPLTCISETAMQQTAQPRNVRSKQMAAN